MNKSVKIVAMGLLFSSVLGTTVTPQMVSAATDKAPSSKVAKQSVLQNDRDVFGEFAVTYENGITERSANNLVGGRISANTTIIKIRARYANPTEPYVFTDSTGRIVYNTGTFLLQGQDLIIPTGTFKAGQTYYLKMLSDSGAPSLIYMTFQVADAVSVATPNVNAVTDQDTTVTGAAQPNTTVHLTINGDPYTATAGANGQFTIQLNKRYAAGSSIDAYAVDGSGNQSGHYTGNVQQSATLGAPTINSVTDKDTYVTGTGEPGAIVYVTMHNNGEEDTFHATVGTDGTYRVNVQQTYPGGTVVEAHQEINGKVSPSTKTTVKHTANLTVDEITTADTNVTGTAMPYSEIHVIADNGSGARDFYGTSKENGDYSVFLQGTKYKAGTVIQVIATAPDGSVQTKNVQVYPMDPQVDDILAGDGYVSGTVDPNANVTVTVGSVSKTVRAEADGSFRVPFDSSLLTSGTRVTVRSTSEGMHSHTITQIVQ